MKSSVLHLKNYFVTNLSVKANQLSDGMTPQAENSFAITTRVQIARHSENKRQWKVSLQVCCSPKEKAFCPYVVDTELVGFFEVEKDLSDDKAEDVIAANAPAVLYSSTRELILLVTGRGPYSPYLLPSATFIDETPSAKKQMAASKSAPEMAPKPPVA